MSLPEPSNEQKLSYIYQTLKAQESRRKRGIIWKFLKWLLLASLIYLAYTYKTLIIEKTYGYVQDRIQLELTKYSEKQKAGILKGIQDIIPPELGEAIKEATKPVEKPKVPTVPEKKK